MTAEQLKPGATFGREFRVERRIAAGGMGTVYECVQLSTGKRRALKVMHARLLRDPRGRDRFLQEARASARIQSDHVVQVMAAGFDDGGIPWMVMELLNGEDLAAALERRGRFGPEEALVIFRQLGHALGAAHEAGLIHRDLKPENIFLADTRREGVPFTVKLLDFGIAKLVQEGATSASHTQAIGSPRWMSPEQAERGGKITPATDVWALGLIAFSLLTGKSYWKTANTPAPSVMQQMCEVLMDPIEAPSKRAVELGHTTPLPDGFDGWFARCVVRDPFERFQDAQEALNAFQAIFRDVDATPAPRAPISAPAKRSEAPVAAPSRAATLAAPAKPSREIRLDAIIPRDETPGSLDASLPAGALPSRRTLDSPTSRRNPALLAGATFAALGLVAAAAWMTTRPSPTVASAPLATQDAGLVTAAPAPPAPVLESAAGDSAVAATADTAAEPYVATPDETALPPPPTAAPSTAPPVIAATTPINAVAAAPGHAGSTRGARAGSSDTVANGTVLPPSLANAVARLADAGPSRAPQPAAAPPAAVQPAAAPTPSGSGGGEGFYARVMSMMRARQGDFVRCYEAGTQGHDGVAGRLEIQFTVSPNGRAENVRARGLEAAPEVGTCVAEIVRGMSFPPGDLGGNPLIHVMNFRREVSAPRPSPSPAPAPAPEAPTEPTGY
jgi:serine/threonine protein kinase